MATSPLLGSNRVQILNPLSKDAKGPGWGLSYFGGGASPVRRVLSGTLPPLAVPIDTH